MTQQRRSRHLQGRISADCNDCFCRDCITLCSAGQRRFLRPSFSIARRARRRGPHCSYPQTRRTSGRFRHIKRVSAKTAIRLVEPWRRLPIPSVRVCPTTVCAILNSSQISRKHYQPPASSKSNMEKTSWLGLVSARRAEALDHGCQQLLRIVAGNDVVCALGDITVAG